MNILDLKITKAYFPEPGHSMLEGEESDDDRNHMNHCLTTTTGMNVQEWKDAIEGHPLFDQPCIPKGWTAWSALTIKGEVVVILVRTLGIMARTFFNVLADMNVYLSEKLPESPEEIYEEFQKLAGRRIREMCNCPRC